MKLAFYAPLKSPHHARPSGDRRIARLFIDALQRAGCEVTVADELRAWEGDGDAAKQNEIKHHGTQIAARLIADYQKLPRAQQPQCWFTYHPYHKSPDWLGVAVSDALNIPYIIAEASLAQKQTDGAWREGHAQTVQCVKRADAIFNLNRADIDGVSRYASRDCIIPLKPFLETPPPSSANKSTLRADIAARRNLNPNDYWLLCVAMMRHGAKLDSYRTLAAAAARMQRRDWRLLIVGDGAAETQVTDLFANTERAHFFGRRDAEYIYELMRAADLFVWPAHKEAFGMAALESLACGLPVVAGDGDGGGICDIVAHGITGTLVAQPDGERMAAAIENLLAAPNVLAKMSAQSVTAFEKHHRLERAAETIGAVLKKLIT